MEGPFIAPLWRDLYTNAKPSDDIYITQDPNFITIRWEVTDCCSLDFPKNFAATLFKNGEIRFDYGSYSGSTNDNSTVGISNGSGQYIASYYDTTSSSLDFVQSSFWTTTSYDDQGAYVEDTTRGWTGTILYANSGSVDLTRYGTYIIEYMYKPASASGISVTRTITVRSPDVTAPVVTLVGS